MTRLSARDAKNRFGEMLDAAQRAPVTIEKHGRPVAVVVSAEDYAFIEQMKLDALRAKIDRSDADFAAGRFFDGEEVFRELDAMIDEAEARGAGGGGV